jgi:hypothetical protein
VVLIDARPAINASKRVYPTFAVSFDQPLALVGIQLFFFQLKGRTEQREEAPNWVEAVNAGSEAMKTDTLHLAPENGLP